MEKNDWYKLGEDIRDQVQRAVDSGDYSGLGKSIGDTVNQAMNEMGSGLNRTVNEVGSGLNRAINEVGNGFNRTVSSVGNDLNRTMNSMGDSINRAADNLSGSVGQSRYAQRPQYKKPNARLDTRFFEKHPKGEVAGPLCMVAGYGMAGVSGIALASNLVVLFTAGGAVSAVISAMGLTVAGLGIGSYGLHQKGRTSRYKRYVDMVKDKLYCSIQDMASKTGRSVKFVRKDLKKMMRLGMFKQAHLDQKETCLIASDEVYEQYRITQKNYEEGQKQPADEKSGSETQKQQKYQSETEQVIQEGRNYIRMIRQCNDEIPGEEMSDKLDRLELLVTRIFGQVEKEPELAPELRKMLSYYLPTTQKLLEAYRDLDKQQIDVSNVAKTKRDIESAVDTINEAFEKFLDELFREKAWDIQSDISVLNTMLKQDGYLQKDFKNKAGT